jgi:hypothetical protein
VCVCVCVCVCVQVGNSGTLLNAEYGRNITRHAAVRPPGFVGDT